MVAQNDLALGKLVEAVSRSKYWASTVIFVTEDDAQSGPDHVDAHRSPALVISPYTSRSTPRADSTPCDTAAMLRTIELILGLSPMSQFDASARPMTTLFGSAADPAPYVALPASVPLTEMNPEPAGGQTGATPTAATPAAALAAAWTAASARLFGGTAQFVPDAQDPELLNRAIWYSVKGYDTPYPGDERVLAPEEVLDREK
jgi:hypothetical protein